MAINSSQLIAKLFFVIFLRHECALIESTTLYMNYLVQWVVSVKTVSKLINCVMPSIEKWRKRSRRVCLRSFCIEHQGDEGIQKWKLLWFSTFVSKASRRELTCVIPAYNSHLSDFPNRWLLSPATSEMMFYPHWTIRLKTDSSVASGPSLSLNIIILLFSSTSWILLISTVPSSLLPLVTFPSSTPADWHSVCVCVLVWECWCVWISLFPSIQSSCFLCCCLPQLSLKRAFQSKSYVVLYSAQKVVSSTWITVVCVGRSWNRQKTEKKNGC